MFVDNDDNDDNSLSNFTAAVSSDFSLPLSLSLSPVLACDKNWIRRAGLCECAALHALCIACGAQNGKNQNIIKIENAIQNSQRWPSIVVGGGDHDFDDDQD